MARFDLLSVVTALLFASSHCCAAEARAPVSAVLIRVVVGEGDPEAAPDKRRILAEPTIATLLGRPATFQSGGEVRADLRDKQSPALPFGTTLRVAVNEASPGKVKGELRLEITNKTGTDSDQVVSTTGVVIQQAGTFTLGTTYRLHNPGKSTTWAEVTITDANEMAQPPRANTPRR